MPKTRGSTSEATGKPAPKRSVKRPRLTRAERAGENRQRMLDTARDLFVSEGYPATTMERIAEQAGFAVQTLYYTFRTKAKLLCEAMEVTAAGEPNPVPVAQRSWMAELMSGPYAPRALALAIEHGTDIFERAAPLWPAMWAAAALDPYVEEYWQGVSAGRRAGMGRPVGRLAALGTLVDDIDEARATDLVFVLFSHETFRGLVSQAGWTIPEYKAWLFSTLSRQLLKPGKIDRSAVAGLSFESLVSES